MVNRRSVLKIGAATVAGVLVKMPASSRSLSVRETHIAFHRAVLDERFAECRVFAAELRQRRRPHFRDSRRCCQTLV